VDRPIYRQLADSIERLIRAGLLAQGEKLPATRELAGQLRLNRTTVAAAYAALEAAGLVKGHVGRGSFVAVSGGKLEGNGFDWSSALFPQESGIPSSQQEIVINFASSRPAQDEFPLAEFRRLAKEVIEGEQAAEVLQLGSPYGYAPLRRHLLSEASAEGTVRAGDDLIVTSGCQQGLDLLSRIFPLRERGVALEDPVYHGLLRVFSQEGSQLLPIGVGPSGIDLDALGHTLERRRPLLVMVTPSFQNPTGTTMPLENRKRLIELARRHGTLLVENDIYSQLRYKGRAVPSLKELDDTGHTILLRSFSKVSFPGLRVGWVIGPRPLIARLAEAKQVSDLHSDQLAQAILLRFVQSGELARHVERTRRRGAERLLAVERACEEFLPEGASWTRPEGGMSLWVDLPTPLSAEKVLARVQERGVDFLPGRHFSERSRHERGLRISFGGLSPEQIRHGIQIIGEAVRQMLAVSSKLGNFESAAALV